jgi:hypothetical protein
LSSLGIPPPFNWDDLLSSWRFGYSVGDPRLEGRVQFAEIPVQSPDGGLRIGENIIDWWPTAELAARRASLTSNGVLGPYWHTSKGTLHTAGLLHQCDGNTEAEAAVFIAASAWDKRRALPEAWAGDTFRLLEQIQYITLYSEDSAFARHGLAIWHHAMRDALPINIIRGGLGECMRPKTYREIIKIALLEAVLSTTNWTPVVVSHNQRGLRTV